MFLKMIIILFLLDQNIVLLLSLNIIFNYQVFTEYLAIVNGQLQSRLYSCKSHIQTNNQFSMADVLKRNVVS